MRKSMERGSGYQTVVVPCELPEPGTAECPVSLITQRSIELVQIVSTIRTAGIRIDVDAPGHLVDALRIIERETAAADAAREESVFNS